MITEIKEFKLCVQRGRNEPINIVNDFEVINFTLTKSIEPINIAFEIQKFLNDIHTPTFNLLVVAAIPKKKRSKK
jgi:hypothetical protein